MQWSFVKGMAESVSRRSARYGSFTAMISRAFGKCGFIRRLLPRGMSAELCIS